jgi:hypothetical protein
LLVCSAVTGIGARMEASTTGRRSKFASFILDVFEAVESWRSFGKEVRSWGRYGPPYEVRLVAAGP